MYGRSRRRSIPWLLMRSRSTSRPRTSTGTCGDLTSATIHLLLDEHADQIFASIDILAERVRRVGGTTIRSIGHIGKLQTIADDNDEFVPAGEMIHRLLEDNAHLARQQRAAHEVCEKHRDSVPAGAGDFIDETERRKWFLFEMYQGADNS